MVPHLYIALGPVLPRVHIFLLNLFLTIHNVHNWGAAGGLLKAFIYTLANLKGC